MIGACLNLGLSNAFAEGGNEELLKHLPQAKVSLVEGIDQLAYDNGPSISGKFEMKQGKLKLSIYTVEKGMAVGAEKNTLLEFIGDATKTTWAPKRTEFADKPHIARASVQLSLLQLGNYSFKEVIRLVGIAHSGMIYSVKPKLINGKGLAEVLIFTPNKDSKKVMFDLSTGIMSSPITN